MSNYEDHPLYSLYLNYAQRSLLGGGKGTFVMEQLKQDSPVLYSLVMDTARQLQKDNIDKNQESRIQEMSKLVKANMSNMINLVDKENKIEGEE